MIEFKSVHKSFGSQQVLRGLDFSIPKGKITVIIGRSGEGKSVLLKHMMGLLKPNAGTVIVEGKDLSQLNEVEIKDIRKSFGMLFQNAALFDSMNVYDNVAFPLTEHTTFTPDEIRSRVQEVLGLVGLSNVDHKLPSELSGGMRKRVGLARAITLKPQILLYDEPTTGLDPLMTDSINQLISSTHKQVGATSVIISHDLEAAFRIADKVAMLYEGKVVLEGNEEDFRRSTHPFIRRFVEGKASGDEL